MEINQPQITGGKRKKRPTPPQPPPPPNTPQSTAPPPPTIPTTPVDSNEIELLSQGAFGCTFQNKGKEGKGNGNGNGNGKGDGLTQSSTVTFHNKIADKFLKNLKCVPPPKNDKYELEKSHLNFISKIQPIDLLDYSGENNEEEIVNTEIVKETLYGEIIQTIPDYYLYFSPLLSSCPFDIGILPHQERMKCKLFNDMDDQRNQPGFFEGMLSPEDTPRTLYINSKVQFVEGTSMLAYFKKILWSDLVYKEGGDIGELSAFFITRFIRSYRHLLKAVRILQKGPESNRIIVHYDLKDQNIIYDTKRGIPIIIDFGLSFDKTVLEQDLHPKTLKEVFYTYYSKYTPWPLDVVVMSYISKVVLLKKGNNDDLMKEIYEKEMVNVENLKKVCDEFFEKNEIFNWIDTLQNPDKAGAAEEKAGKEGAAEEKAEEGKEEKEKALEGVKVGEVGEAVEGVELGEVGEAVEVVEAVEGVGVVEAVEGVVETVEAVKGENIKKVVENKQSKNVDGVDTGNTGNTGNNFISSFFNFNTPAPGVKKDETPPLDSTQTTTVDGVKSIRDKMKIQWYAYIDSFNGKVWKELSSDLTQRYALWDVYSISVCFLEYIYQLELLTGKYKIPPFFMDFVEELKRVFDK